MNVIVRTGKRQRSYIGATAFTTQEVTIRPGAFSRLSPAPPGRQRAGTAFSSKTKQAIRVTPTTPPRVRIIAPPIKPNRAPWLATVVTNLSRIPPLPKTFSKPLIVAPQPTGKRLPPAAFYRLTRRDRGFSHPRPQAIVSQPARTRARPFHPVSLKSPGVPKAFHRPIFAPAPRPLTYRRDALSLTTRFYSRRPNPRITVVSPAPRARRPPPEVHVRHGKALQRPIVRRPVIVSRPAPSAQAGKVVALRNKVRHEVPPRPIVVRARGHAIPPKLASVTRTPFRFAPPRPAQVVARPAPVRHRPKDVVVSRTSRGGQIGSRPVPRQTIVQRPPAKRTAPQSVALRSGRRPGAMIRITPRLTVTLAPPKFRMPQIVSLKTKPTSPRGTKFPTKIVTVLAPRIPQKIAPPSILIKTPQPAAGMPVDLPDAVFTWLLNQPAFIAAFGFNPVFNQNLSADWDDPGGAYPYLIYREPESDRDYESAGGNKSVGGYEEDSQFEMAIVHDSKEVARQLGKLVGSILNDAPLEFDGGSVFYFRWRNPGFPPTPSKGREDNTWVWRRVLMFDYKIEGFLP